MYILGDIGNTDTKLFLVSTKNKVLKKALNEIKNTLYQAYKAMNDNKKLMRVF